MAVSVSSRRKGLIMNRLRLLSVLVTLVAAMVVVLLWSPCTEAGGTLPIYNPYPAGILPGNLNAEIIRVRSEIQTIFNQALGEMRALPPFTVTGQPPTFQGNGYQAVQTLGKLMNFDENMSPLKNRACAFCHMPYAGFSG